MLKEFKEFIAKGNMLDLAVGIIIGAAFTALVGSFVKDIISPFIGLLGSANFDNMSLVLKQGPTPEQAVVLSYGAFLTMLLQFLITAFVVFMIVKAANRLRKEEAPAPAAPPEDVKLLTEIRDLLAKRA
jgi:large conductance mechanosensitive channel